MLLLSSALFGSIFIYNKKSPWMKHWHSTEGWFYCIVWLSCPLCSNWQIKPKNLWNIQLISQWNNQCGGGSLRIGKWWDRNFEEELNGRSGFRTPQLQSWRRIKRKLNFSHKDWTMKVALEKGQVLFLRVIIFALVSMVWKHHWIICPFCNKCWLVKGFFQLRTHC